MTASLKTQPAGEAQAVLHLQNRLTLVHWLLAHRHHRGDHLAHCDCRLSADALGHHHRRRRQDLHHHEEHRRRHLLQAQEVQSLEDMRHVVC